MKMNELCDGARGRFVVLLSSLTKGVTAKGAPYLSFVFQDKTGSIDAKYWSPTQEQLLALKAGMIVEVDGEVISYNKQLQMKVNSLKVVDRSHVDLNDFIKEGDIPRSVLKKNISQIIDQFENKTLKTLILKVMEKVELDFYNYPAAAKIHHDFVGGLATHVWGMIKLANVICDCYPSLNRELLISGVILHDIGKCVELSGPVITEYTTEGKLLGHISIMQALVYEVAKENNLLGEEVMLVRHMILSHHGEYEFGSPVLPMIPEAEILHYIDNIDARMNILSKAYEGVEEGEFTARQFALENRAFYKSKLK